MINYCKIFESKDIDVYYNFEYDSDFTIITFSSLDTSPQEDDYQERVFYEKNKITGFSIVDKTSGWYCSPDMKRVIHLIDKLKTARPIITTGSSMGAYGALKFSRSLRADIALAFSPLWSIDPTQAPFDMRFSHLFNPMTMTRMGVHPDDVAGCTVIVISDLKDRLENVNATKIHAVCANSDRGACVINAPYTGHWSRLVTPDTESYGILVKLALRRDKSNLVNFVRERRKSSLVYLMGLESKISKSIPQAKRGLVRKIESCHPSSFNINLMLSSYYLKNNKNKQALAVLNSISPKPHQYADHCHNLSKIYSAQGDLDKALYWSRLAYSSHHLCALNKRRQYLVQLVQLMMMNNEEDKALALCQAFISEVPLDYIGHVLSSEIYRRKSLWKCFEDVLRDGIKCSAGAIQCFNLLSLHLYITGRKEEAIELQNEAVELFPLSASANRAMSQIYHKEQNSVGASRHAHFVAKCDPENPNNLYYSAYMLLKHGEIDDIIKAKEYCIRAISLSNKNIQSHHLLYAEICHKLDK